MTVGEKIRSSRINAGLTQKELGIRMGVDSATIGKYERGILNPKLQTLEKFAAALGVTVWELGATNSLEYRKVVMEREFDKSKERSSEELRLYQLEIKFKKLNVSGQEKALERISELTEIPRFLKEKAPPYAVVWCGPSIPNLMQQAAIFTGILPTDVKEFLDNHPGAGCLLVPEDDLAATFEKINKGSEGGQPVPRERIYYERIKLEVGDMPLDAHYKYHRYKAYGTMPEDTAPKKD